MLLRWSDWVFKNLILLQNTHFFIWYFFSFYIWTVRSVPGNLRRTAAGLFLCPPPGATKPPLQWRTPAAHRCLLGTLLALKTKGTISKSTIKSKLQKNCVDLTISWVVDDFGEAVGSVSFHIKRLYLHLELSHLEVLLSGKEVGVFVNVSPRLRIRDGLVPPVISVVGLESHDVTKFFAIEKPWLHGLKEEGDTSKSESTYIGIRIGKHLQSMWWWFRRFYLHIQPHQWEKPQELLGRMFPFIYKIWWKVQNWNI